jgi:DNA-binding GntR family transcriptional regulator
MTWKFRTDEVYQLLRKKLMAMEFKPGQLLSEKEIVSRFKLSRTPVRQALSKMERDGLVEIIPRKGALIRSLSIKDIREVYQIRKALEGMAARLVAENINPNALKKFEKFEDVYLNGLKKNSEGGLVKLVDLGLKFHELIIDRADNSRIKSILRDLQVQLVISRLFVLNPNSKTRPSRAIQSIKEHLAIIEALKKGDGGLAEVKMREHINHAEKYALSFWG